MKVAVVGSGGREHALAWACAKSPSVEKVYSIPGNPGTKRVAGNVQMDPFDFRAIAGFCHKEKIDLVVVGPEGPLASGIGDFLRQEGLNVFGPGQKGAILESSKGYARDFMRRHGIPHPEYQVCDSLGEAVRYLEAHDGPYVVKADGLALGKGVSICKTREEAMRTAEEMLSGRLHGQAGQRVVLEEFLTGTEATAMAFFDGTSVVPLPLAKDHKRLEDNDLGPMTGGMGAYAPFEPSEPSELSFEATGAHNRGIQKHVPIDAQKDVKSGVRSDMKSNTKTEIKSNIESNIESNIKRHILEKTALGLIEEGIDFRGLIYAGLMITDQGPKVLEYNVRFGDPETQCVVPLIDGDFAWALFDCSKGQLKGVGTSSPYFRIRHGYCAVVVMTSQGYPGKYSKGLPISGLEWLEEQEGAAKDVFLFHAGTKEESGQVVTWGGRVLSVGGIGSTLASARQKAYDAVAKIRFEGAFYRKDIGVR